MPQLIVTKMLYHDDLLQAWKQKNYGMLRSSPVCDEIKNVLYGKVQRKAGPRTNTWFFGEAYVATRIPHQYGHYTSFKWLTNRCFSNDDDFREGPSRERQRALRMALRKHFGETAIKNLQA